MINGNLDFFDLYIGSPGEVQHTPSGPRRRMGQNKYETSSKISRGGNYLEFDLTSFWLSKIVSKFFFKGFVVGGPEAGFDPQEEINFMEMNEGDSKWIIMTI